MPSSAFAPSASFSPMWICTKSIILNNGAVQIFSLLAFSLATLSAALEQIHSSASALILERDGLHSRTTLSPLPARREVLSLPSRTLCFAYFYRAGLLVVYFPDGAQLRRRLISPLFAHDFVFIALVLRVFVLPRCISLLNIVSAFSRLMIAFMGGRAAPSAGCLHAKGCGKKPFFSVNSLTAAGPEMTSLPRREHPEIERDEEFITLAHPNRQSVA
ncbi:uncharacterized protein BT62DRAFT_1012448 [Guyanagaster necrorhizus]|uniref:Uncharacterized protein n=1 Tax=Guyanagaster necrorhizus TaxID=856835 RepID=A0A9P8ALW9_9AGAR|nr:uncharacterized protein BT62DRAFT_1012448 [Guyanagaster necrorhizus MCA 3950]KAG7440673.1 hypothetical protein BT62DRAFT_1012448 [Guyanagaster necrorhizus MCA 3950]